MKRFVNVPTSLTVNGIPEEAKRLSEQSQLPIRISDDCLDIDIISIPEIFEIESAEQIKSGYIYWLDITDEYNVFDKNTHIIYRSDNFEGKFFPTVKEKHVLRFRNRLFEKGNYMYYLINNNSTLHEGSFTVL